MVLFLKPPSLFSLATWPNYPALLLRNSWSVSVTLLVRSDWETFAVLLRDTKSISLNPLLYGFSDSPGTIWLWNFCSSSSGHLVDLFTLCLTDSVTLQYNLNVKLFSYITNIILYKNSTASSPYNSLSRFAWAAILFRLNNRISLSCKTMKQDNVCSEICKYF